MKSLNIVSSVKREELHAYALTHMKKERQLCMYIQFSIIVVEFHFLNL